MTDRRASGDGLQRRARIHSPSADLPQGQSTSSAISSSSNPRKRPGRAKQTRNDSPQHPTPQWVDHSQPESSKAKEGSIAARERSGSGSPTSTTPSDSGPTLETSEETSEEETDVVGHPPKLSRIPERKDSKTSQHRRGSSASSADETTKFSRRPRNPQDGGIARHSAKQKHSSLRRRAESLADLQNPSLVSVLSAATQHTSTSSGSNSTITQQSYDNSHPMKRRPPKNKMRLQADRTPPSSSSMNSQPPAVFQYISESMASEQFRNDPPANDRHHPSPTSSGSYSSRDTDHEEVPSSEEGSIHDESPLTSPASARAPEYEESEYHGQSGSEAEESARESSPEPIHATPGSHQVTIDEASDEEGEEHDTTNSEGDDDSTDDHEEGPRPAHHLALERIAPLRIPSASSSRHSDPHTRRLRTQEQDLRDHVFQSPQPQRDFNFVGTPSTYPQPPASMYDSYPPPTASPTNPYTSPTNPYAPPTNPYAPPTNPYAPPTNPYASPTNPYTSTTNPYAPPTNPYALAHQGPGWPPAVPPVPYSPGDEGRFAMAPFSPQAQAPGGMVHMPQDLAHTQPPRYQPYSSGPDPSKTTVVGYELLADKLTEVSKQENATSTEGQVVPMYRKFEKLNHRILLHLQDEITELEEELRFIDESIAQGSPRGDAGQMHPASRRGEARYGGELHFKRTELLGRIYIKLGQYNQALSSYSNMLKNLDPAGEEDAQTYHNWLEKHAPIDRAEARFLEHKSDLLAVSRRKSAFAVGGVGLHQSFAIALPLILMLPLTSFAMIPGLLGRLFIIILIGSMEIYLVVSTELLRLMTIKEWTLCTCV
ncbi:hypothetical protein P154DRAFT_288311 [Amniculicola lignicola CBS 123094]|uniref:DUF6594 domain-containing protein n=1 Tax=Amniculicola lignicola CBS 123094 TaxID=1392246 RepID=A0A6A5X0A1_9PLEO|nr:hypothetical protein P154DRAFT_288311 [Amniculicola lignicola CBS 123094]